MVLTHFPLFKSFSFPRSAFLELRMIIWYVKLRASIIHQNQFIERPRKGVRSLTAEEWRLINCDTLLEFERPTCHQLEAEITRQGRSRCHSALKLENFTYLFSRRRNKIFRITIEDFCNCRRAGKSVLKIFTSRTMCLNKFSFTRFTSDSSEINEIYLAI